MNYITCLSGLILPPKSSKFLEFALRWLPILQITYLLSYPTNFCPAPSLQLTVTLGQNRVKLCFSSTSTSGNPFPSYPAQRKSLFLLMPPKVMTLHVITTEIHPTSVAPGLKSPFWKISRPFTALTMPPTCPSHRALSPQGTVPCSQWHFREPTCLPKNTPPIFSVDSAQQLTAWAQLHH